MDLIFSKVFSGPSGDAPRWEGLRAVGMGWAECSCNPLVMFNTLLLNIAIEFVDSNMAIENCC